MTFGEGGFCYESAHHWAQLPNGWTFLDVGGIAIDSDDRVFVVNRSDHPVVIFDADGRVLDSWGAGFFGRAHGCCMCPDDTIYCTDDLNHTVSKFSMEGGLLMTLGEKGKGSDTGYVNTFSLWDSLSRIVRGAPPFNRPTGVAVGPSGDVYVADGYGNARLHRFSSSGTFASSWGEPGSAIGCFRLPHSVRVDDSERVWVADRENNRIQIFDSEGGFIDQWTDLVRPTDLFIDNRAGTVYVTELCNRVSIFTIGGRLLARWGNTGASIENALFVSPHAIAVDSRGDIYVGEVAMTGWRVDRGSEALHKFVRVS